MPTRLPDSGWRYYGMRSQLTEDGYKLTAYRSAKAVPAETMLLGAEAAAVPAASDVLYRLAAGHAAEAGLAVPASAKLVQGDGTVGWKFWSSGADAESEEQLSRKFAALVKTGAPVSGATGTVLVTRADDGKLTYSASWTNDGRTHYSFVGYGSLDDFVSMLTSFRPVINLFDAADIVLLPDDMQLNLQPGRGSMFVPYENRFVSLAKAPLVKNGTAFLPLRDIARIIGGEIQYVAEGSGNAVYVSRNGWQNELKLRLSTGDVFRKGEKLATVPLVVQEGTTLVPLRFMSDLYGLPVTYDAASQAITVHRANWFTNHAVPSVGSGADYKTSVLSVGGPPFTYSNGRLGQGPVWGYEQRKPPLGYNSLKYQVYHVGVPLLPGDNSFVLRDMQTKRVIDSIPLRTTMTAADVPFRTDGAMLADGLKPDLRLTGSNGKSWPGGYAEISDGAAVDLAGKGWSYDYVQLSYRFGELESKRVQIPVKDGTLAYRLIPNKGPGTYEVTLYTPPGIMPGMGEKAAAPLVRFVVVIL
ncbi:copper amine oxidase N-terminal domain-containing protein [Paenibacillus sp. UNC496MF]|uniref:copper amine oxidase N-terminal domain-containing protein n=1 Tax=Paenibacillus sp. UNC496MF TaxID=1502753 RepID=UPI00210954A3|nr:copper amine oxidase N-terminal domain-containing protein [Paenibacillus sp. UNC496MF]